MIIVDKRIKEIVDRRLFGYGYKKYDMVDWCFMLGLEETEELIEATLVWYSDNAF